MNAVAMNNLLNYLQELSLTASNRKWLADKLIEPLEDTVSESDVEILDGIKNSLSQLKDYKEGKIEFGTWEELMNEI